MSFYNTRTRRKEVFEPLDSSNVRVYLCGPTVYDRAHIGNARPAVVFDVLYRLLMREFGEASVVFVRNITDVDDKINARAQSLKRSGDGRPLLEIVRAVTDETASWYRDDMAALAVLPPVHEPRATEFIPEMIELISRLIAFGHAYLAEQHVLFNVDTHGDYGRFAKRSLDDMVAGARVEVAPFKRNPLDFVLWKPSSEDEPGWDSPWGRGRPGWHIECSAMSLELLGETFDIHAGGADLIFPHHENEIAQSLCANPGSEFARYWLHNGYLQVDGQKMAKSLGNFLTVKDLRDKGAGGAEIRLALLSTHYRHPLDWTERKLGEASRVLARWSKLTGDVPDEECAPELVHPEVVDALADDLNTPAALAVLHRLFRAGDARALKASAGLMGLLDAVAADAPVFADRSVKELIEGMLLARSEARVRREFAAADRIRDLLNRAGVEIRDGPDGTQWQPSAAFDPELIIASQAADSVTERRPQQ